MLSALIVPLIIKFRHLKPGWLDSNSISGIKNSTQVTDNATKNNELIHRTPKVKIEESDIKRVIDEDADPSIIAAIEEEIGGSFFTTEGAHEAILDVGYFSQPRSIVDLISSHFKIGDIFGVDHNVFAATYPISNHHRIELGAMRIYMDYIYEKYVSVFMKTK